MNVIYLDDTQLEGIVGGSVTVIDVPPADKILYFLDGSPGPERAVEGFAHNPESVPIKIYTLT